MGVSPGAPAHCFHSGQALNHPLQVHLAAQDTSSFGKAAINKPVPNGVSCKTLPTRLARVPLSLRIILLNYAFTQHMVFNFLGGILARATGRVSYAFHQTFLLTHD